ncbi:9635_t:CDS:1, partial [Racocetra persica]
RKEYLWCSKNYSSISHHIGAFLRNELVEIVEKIVSEKLAAVVSDNGSNVHVAREILCKKYLHILNLQYIPHCINLITEDLYKHKYVVEMIHKIGVLHKYFTKSHAA